MARRERIGLESLLFITAIVLTFMGAPSLSSASVQEQTPIETVTATPAPEGGVQDAKPTPPAPNAASVTLSPKDCIEPEPTFTGLEYNGPFKKTIVHITGKPEIKTVHHPHEGSGRICSLPVKQKFILFAKDTFEPVTFIISGFNAGIAQAQNDDPSFGQGMEGFGRRYGAAFADQVSGEFWGTFFYPTLLHEDPRYYRQGHGKVGSRLYHALEHSVVTHQDSGRHMFNFSEWMAATSTTALGNLYHPGNHRGFQPAARGVVYSVAFDAGIDILREFWPEISSRLRFPFIAHTEQTKK